MILDDTRRIYFSVKQPKSLKLISSWSFINRLKQIVGTNKKTIPHEELSEEDQLADNLEQNSIDEITCLANDLPVSLSIASNLVNKLIHSLMVQLGSFEKYVEQDLNFFEPGIVYPLKNKQTERVTLKLVEDFNDPDYVDAMFFKILSESETMTESNYNNLFQKLSNISIDAKMRDHIHKRLQSVALPFEIDTNSIIYPHGLNLYITDYHFMLIYAAQLLVLFSQNNQGDTFRTRKILSEIVQGSLISFIANQLDELKDVDIEQYGELEELLSIVHLWEFCLDVYVSGTCLSQRIWKGINKRVSNFLFNVLRATDNFDPKSIIHCTKMLLRIVSLPGYDSEFYETLICSIFIQDLNSDISKNIKYINALHEKVNLMKIYSCRHQILFFLYQKTRNFYQSIIKSCTLEIEDPFASCSQVIG